MERRVVSVCGLGAISPLGMEVAQFVAHVRAGISAASESEFVDEDGHPVVLAALAGHQLPSMILPSSIPLREQELVRLASGAIDQAVRFVAENTTPIPTWCAWPSREAESPLSATRCAALLGSRLEVRASFNGGTAAIQALEAASSWILYNGGVALVVAADSHVHPFILAKLLTENRVKTERQKDGMIPGQGAAAVLIGDSETIAELGLPCISTIAGVSNVFDPHIDPRGDGLAQALRQAYGDEGATVCAWWTSLSGERSQAQEHSTAQIRSADFFSENIRVHHLAMYLGDTGAAGPLLATVCALSGVERPVMLSATADDDHRAAVLFI